MGGAENRHRERVDAVKTQVIDAARRFAEHDEFDQDEAEIKKNFVAAKAGYGRKYLQNNGVFTAVALELSWVSTGRGKIVVDIPGFEEWDGDENEAETDA